MARKPAPLPLVGIAACTTAFAALLGASALLLQVAGVYGTTIDAGASGIVFAIGAPIESADAGSSSMRTASCAPLVASR